jgi:hypothetical protein
MLAQSVTPVHPGRTRAREAGLTIPEGVIGLPTPNGGQSTPIQLTSPPTPRILASPYAV